MTLLSPALARIKPSATIAAGQYAAQLRAAGKDIIALSAGEPDFDTPPHIREAAAKAMEQGHTRYTAVSGVSELRDAVAGKFKRENALDYSPNEIIVSTGGKQVISIGERCLLGANSGVGISLGDDCVVEAGAYVTAGTKVTLADGRTIKAAELSGASNVLFRRNSVSGAMEAVAWKGEGIALNAALHAN